MKNNISCKIEWAPKNKLRVRKVVNRSNHKPSGKYPCLTMGRMVRWESQLERDALYLLDAHPLVKEISEQPAKIYFKLNGNDQTHVPDFFVRFKQIKYFVEVKPEKEARKIFYRQRTKLLKELLPIQGFRYHLITEKDIRQEPRLSNAVFILRYGRNHLETIEREKLIRTLRKIPKLYWDDVLAGMVPSELIQGICRLILDGALHIDPHSKAENHISIHNKVLPSEEVLLWA